MFFIELNVLFKRLNISARHCCFRWCFVHGSKTENTNTSLCSFSESEPRCFFAFSFLAQLIYNNSDMYAVGYNGICYVKYWSSDFQQLFIVNNTVLLYRMVIIVFIFVYCEPDYPTTTRHNLLCLKRCSLCTRWSLKKVCFQGNIDLNG